MKSWMFLITILATSSYAQGTKPLSSRIEELLKNKKAKKEQEAMTVEKIKMEAMLEQQQRQEKIKRQKAKEDLLKKAKEQQFVPVTSFLNFRPLEDQILWKTTLKFSYDGHKTAEDTIQKEFTTTHLQNINEFQYSWSKKLLFKYVNHFHFDEKIKNKKRTVNGSSITPDPDLQNNKFGDHIFEVNYRKHREIFYGYDLDYFFKIIYPFGEASRAYAYGTGSESDTSQTTASQKGNLKSSFGANPRFGIDYYAGEKRDRYNYGTSLGYALKGRYIRNKGTGYFTTSASGLLIKTQSYFDLKFWFNYQKRPKLLERTYFGAGFVGSFFTQQEENLLTNGTDGLTWNERKRTEPHLELKALFWTTYMLSEKRHLQFTLDLGLPINYKIKRQLIDESANSGGDRVFNNINSTEKVEGKNPIGLSVTYAHSF